MNLKLALIHKYISQDDLVTSDPYDVWNTKIGQTVKKIYYQNKILGIGPSALLTIFDQYINNKPRFGYSPRSYPIVHAYKVLISLQLYCQNKDSRYVLLAQESINWLIRNYSKNYSGYCWGINMPWVSKIATYDENVPHVTHTPYVLEAFLKFQKITNTNRYDDVIDSVFNFLDHDLVKMIDSSHTLALSYSPKLEKRIVVNANSYAMFCYALFRSRNVHDVKVIDDKIKRIYNFLISCQNEDGSWYYFADVNPGNFIDCFHTCFILKNIIKVNKIVSLQNSSTVVSKSYHHLKQNFWDKDKKLFKRFTVTDRASLIKYDLYDNAEMLNLAVLLNDTALIETLTNSIQKNFVSQEAIYSNIVFPNYRINKDTLRWAVLPYLFALSQIKAKID